MTLSTILFAGVALLALALGAVDVALGLAVLIGLVSATASLPWQLGGENLALPAVYALFLTGGFMASGRAKPRLVPLAIAVPAVALVMVLLVSTTLYLSRNEFPVLATAQASAGGAFGEVGHFRPFGPAGVLQAAWILAMGPALLWVASHACVAGRGRRMVVIGITAGLAVAVIAPLIQVMWLDPTVRPDMGLTNSTGLVGFFQDPHSYAAYLVLGMAATAGVARAELDSGRRGRSLALTVLVAAGLVVLLFTNSLSGLLAAALALALVLLVGRAAQVDAGYLPQSLKAFAARHRVGFAGLVVIVMALAAIVGIGASEAARATATRLLRATLSEARIWEPSGAMDVGISVDLRMLYWRKAVETISLRPLWGTGPATLPGVVASRSDAADPALPPVAARENAHNYYLQVAAELGLPALIAFGWLVGSVLLHISRGARRVRGTSRRWLLGIMAGQGGILGLCLLSHPLLLAEVQAAYWVLAGLGLGIIAATGADAVEPGSFA